MVACRPVFQKIPVIPAVAIFIAGHLHAPHALVGDVVEELVRWMLAAPRGGMAQFFPMGVGLLPGNRAVRMIACKGTQGSFFVECGFAEQRTIFPPPLPAACL